MQSYNTILGVINMRQNKCTFSTIQQRYHIGSNATQLILKRFKESGIALVELRKMAPHEVETLFYPPLNLKRKDIPEPDFQYWYDRIHAKDSKVNLAYCWIEYREQNPDGYGHSQFYGAVAKYFVPDNLKTAVKKHTRDELTLQSAFSDLEDFYDTIVLPPPPYKPKGKATVEGHVKYLETHLVEKLKEKKYTSLEQINAEIKKIVVVLNSRNYQGKTFSRQDVFEKYDKPCMKPLPGDRFTVCDYKYVLSVPDNYHIEYDNHYYSVFYSYYGKPAILKATATEIRICDQYNKLICKHRRAYAPFPVGGGQNNHSKGGEKRPILGKLRNQQLSLLNLFSNRFA